MIFCFVSRHVRVVPEIDVPAHTRSWAHAFPEIMVKCPNTAAMQQAPMNVYTLHPLKNLTYTVVEEVLRQIVEVFPDP